MSKGRILLVDDTATYRKMLGDALMESGYEVDYARDGLEALDKLKEQLASIDLMVLDLLMPKMLGFDVLKEVRRMEGGDNLAVMVISGLFKHMEDLKQVRELGAIGFIDKDWSLEDVVARIDNYLHPQWEDKFVNQAKTAFSISYRVGEKPYTAYTHSIGPEGLYISTADVGPPGAEVKVRFRIDEMGETIEAQGRISLVVTETETSGKWKLPPGIAVEFTEIAPEHRAAIEQWMKNHPDGSVGTA